MKSTRCPACLAIFDVPASYIGRDVSCPSCKKDFALTEANCANESAAAMQAKVGGGSPDSNSPTESRKSKSNGGNGGSLVALAVSVIVIFFFFRGCGSDDKTREVDFNNDVHGAWAYTQQFVEKQTDPKPADFPSWSESFVTPLGNARYTVSAYVDTENASGGKIRQHFIAIIVRSSDSEWTLESLNFSE